MKSRLQLASASAALFAAVSAVQAEVKINDTVSLDGYATISGVVSEGTVESNGEFFNSGRVYDSAVIGATATYSDLTARVSLIGLVGNGGASPDADRFDAYLLDAYATYKVGNLAFTGGQYLGWLGYESFHSVNNAFISYGLATYQSPYATGAKAEYTGEGFSAGISARDTTIESFFVPVANSPFEGDGEFSDDLGYEAYFLFTGIEKLSWFVGVGTEDIDVFETITTYDTWVSYSLTDALSVAAEYAVLEEINNGSWLLQTTYKVSEPLSVSARLTGSDGDNGAGDAVGYGLASTYTVTENFALKGEVTKTDVSVGGDSFSYALQGIFKF